MGMTTSDAHRLITYCATIDPWLPKNPEPARAAATAAAWLDTLGQAITYDEARATAIDLARRGQRIAPGLIYDAWCKTNTPKHSQGVTRPTAPRPAITGPCDHGTPDGPAYCALCRGATSRARPATTGRSAVIIGELLPAPQEGDPA